MRLIPPIIQHLPDSLTSLRMDGIYTASSHSLITSLPTHLVSLQCKFSNVMLEKAPFLAALSGLASLETLILPDLDFFSKDDPILHVPTSLTHLQLYYGWDLTASRHAATRLPRLKRLDLIRSEVSEDAYFPNSLTRLTMHGMSRIPTQVLERLPPNLEWLLIPALSSWNFSILPRSLHSLELDTTAVLASLDELGGEEPVLELIRGLPPSLTQFRIPYFGEKVCLNLVSKALPSSLTDTDRMYYFSSKSERDLQSILPRSLTKLVGMADISFYNSIPSSCCTSLPENLKTLTIYRRDQSMSPEIELKDAKEALSWTIIGNLLPILPASLTELNLADTRYVSDACLVGLPRSLRCLRLPHYDNKTCRMSFTTAGLKSLPPHLTELSLVLNSQVDASFFPNLPSELLHLQLEGLDMVQDEDISLLPRSLTFLSLSPAKRLTNDCIPRLPPLLSFLGLPKVENLTPDMIQLLPRFLRRVDIRRCLFPRPLRKTLPPRLHFKTKLWTTSLY
jgi:hypothetical protein